MKFGWTIVYVADVAASLQFWEAAFGFSRRFASEDGTYGELATGETTIAFAARSMAAAAGVAVEFPEPGRIAPGVELALTTDDVPGAFARAVAAGAVAVKEPAVMSWGQTVSYVRDLDGVLVEICSPVE
ncbi:MAG: VOC family protein [Chloroflexota bacterium]